MCRATKGSDGNVSLCYTNVTAGAGWRQTLYQTEPWLVRPSFMDLPGFSLRLLAPDLLHIFHIGVARDLIGSALRVLTLTNVLFAGRTQVLRLRTATDRLLDFVQHHGYHLSIKKLTTKNLGFGGKKFPEIHCKGYDAFVILRWLVAETQQAPRNHSLLCAALWTADSFMSVLTHGGRFLTNEEIQHKCCIGDVFCRIYMTLASRAMTARRFLWRVRPKFHLLQHVLLDQSCFNVTYMSTWLDEDFLKHAMAIKKKVHRKTATRRTLERWLAGLPSYFEHASAG